MEKISIKKSEFDFSRFSKAILKFLSTQVSEEVDPSYAIVMVDKPGGCPRYGPEKGRSDFLKELSDGCSLFFPFSTSNVGDPVECADGNSYEIDEDSDFCIGEIDCVGYLIGLKDNQWVINSAVHAGGCAPPPSVDIVNCDVFDKPMKFFIQKFIHKPVKNPKKKPARMG